MNSDQSAPNIGFIVGMPRAGTTWLSKTLDSNPNVSVFGETMFWGKKYLIPENGSDYTDRQISQIIAELRNPNRINSCASEKNLSAQGRYEQVNRSLQQIETKNDKSVFAELCAAIARHDKTQFVLEKTPHHVRFVDDISVRFPSSRWIILVRSPLTFMQSYKYRGDRETGATRKRFNRLYSPIICSIIWRLYFAHCARAKALLGSRALWVDFEALTSNPVVVIRDALVHIGVEDSGQFIESLDKNSSFSNGGREPSLTTAELFWLNRICGSVAEKAGYEIPDVKPSYWEVAVTIFQLPKWLAHAGVWFFSKGPTSGVRYIMHALKLR